MPTYPLRPNVAEVTDVDAEETITLPAAVEPHAHLDKAFLADVVTNETGDLLGAIEAIDRQLEEVDRK